VHRQACLSAAPPWNFTRFPRTVLLGATPPAPGEPTTSGIIARVVPSSSAAAVRNCSAPPGTRCSTQTRLARAATFTGIRGKARLAIRFLLPKAARHASDRCRFCHYSSPHIAPRRLRLSPLVPQRRGRCRLPRVTHRTQGVDRSKNSGADHRPTPSRLMPPKARA